MSFLFKKKQRRYGDVKSKHLPTRGLDWLSPRTKEAMRFIRTPELRAIGGRWGERALGAVCQAPVAALGFGASTPSAAHVSGQPVAQQVPSAAVRPSAQPSAPTAGAGPIVAPGLAATRTYTVGGRTVTQAPTPFVVTPSIPKAGGRPATSAGPIK